MKYGPTTDLVQVHLARLRAITWFSGIERPTELDHTVHREPLEFLIDHRDDRWAGPIAERQIEIDQAIMAMGRLEFQVALDADLKKGIFNPSMDEFFCDLPDRFPGYWRDTFTYSWERIDLPEREIRYCLYECIVPDAISSSDFSFRDLMPWFERGCWPCGLRDGQLIVI